MPIDFSGGLDPNTILGITLDARDAGDFVYFGNDPGNQIAFSNDPYGMTETHIAGRVFGVAPQDVSIWWRTGDLGRKINVEKTWTVTKEPISKPSSR
jgi:hypothetical protein